MDTIEQLFSVRDQVTVVTGAGRGVGRALAHAFAEAGSDVVAAGRTESAIEATAADVRARGRQALAVPVDVRSAASVDALVEAAVGRFGRLDVLIANAGIYVNRQATEMTEEEWDLMADTNLKGVFFCARAAARVMIPRGFGRIISISTALADVAQEGYACYGATKAGVQQLTRILALEWARYGITVNAIAPTTTELPEHPERLRTPRRSLGPGRRSRFAAMAGRPTWLTSPSTWPAPPRPS